MLADPKRRVEFVVGVDTHRDQHALVVVDAISGKVCAETVVVASRAGYAQAVAFADRHAGVACGRWRALAAMALV